MITREAAWFIISDDSLCLSVKIWPQETGNIPLSDGVKLNVKMLKTDLYSAIKSEDSEALDSGTSQLGSQRGFGGIEMF